MHTITTYTTHTGSTAWTVTYTDERGESHDLNAHGSPCATAAACADFVDQLFEVDAFDGATRDALLADLDVEGYARRLGERHAELAIAAHIEGRPINPFHGDEDSRFGRAYDQGARDHLDRVAQSDPYPARQYAATEVIRAYEVAL